MKSVVEEILEDYGKNILGFCIALTGNRDEAEDLFQDTFLRLSIISKKIKREENIKAFAMSVAARLYKDSYKKNLRRNEIAPQVYDDEILNNLTSSYDIERDYEKKQEAKVVQKAIMGLEENHKSVLLLHYMGDLSIEEIARLMKVPIGTVKSRLYYGREKIKKILEVEV